MKDAKVQTKYAKLREKIGGKNKTDHSSPTRPTNALTLQATTEHVIAPRDNNHTLLTGQIFIKIIHHPRLILPNNICNKVHQQ